MTKDSFILLVRENIASFLIGYLFGAGLMPMLIESLQL